MFENWRKKWILAAYKQWNPCLYQVQVFLGSQVMESRTSFRLVSECLLWMMTPFVSWSWRRCSRSASMKVPSNTQTYLWIFLLRIVHFWIFFIFLFCSYYVFLEVQICISIFLGFVWLFTCQILGWIYRVFFLFFYFL